MVTFGCAIHDADEVLEVVQYGSESERAQELRSERSKCHAKREDQVSTSRDDGHSAEKRGRAHAHQDLTRPIQRTSSTVSGRNISLSSAGFR